MKEKIKEIVVMALFAVFMVAVWLMPSTIAYALDYTTLAIILLFWPAGLLILDNYFWRY